MGRIVRSCAGCGSNVMAVCEYGCLSDHFCKGCGDEFAISLEDYVATLMPRRRKKRDYNSNQEGK